MPAVVLRLGSVEYRLTVVASASEPAQALAEFTHRRQGDHHDDCNQTFSSADARHEARGHCHNTTVNSAAELAAALRRAAAAHGEHEKRTGEDDVSWPDWYAEYIVREQAGEPSPS